MSSRPQVAEDPQQVGRVLVDYVPMPPQKGDVAISLGLIKLVRAAAPDARITALAENCDLSAPDNVGGFAATYGIDDFIEKRSVAASEGSNGKASGGLLGRLARLVRNRGPEVFYREYALCLLRMLGRRALPWLRGSVGALARAVAESDVVLLRGGGYIASPHIVADICALRLGAFYALNLARALRVPYAIWGHTFFNLDGPRSIRELQPVVRGSRVTVCREARSRDYLTSRGVPPGKLAVLPDTAFSLEPGPAERRQELLEAEGLADLGAPILGVNVRDLWGEKTAAGKLVDRQLDAVEQAVRYMREHHGAAPVLLPHGFSNRIFELPGPEQDRRPLEVLFERLSRDGKAFLIQGDYRPTDLLTLYSSFDAVVCSRLHVGILAACGGVPSVAIAYQRTKTFGIAQMMGQDEYVVDLADIDPEALTQTVERLWQHREQLSKRLLEETLPRLRAQLSDYARLTMEGV